MVQPDCPRPARDSRIVGTTVPIPESDKGGRITGTRLGVEQRDQRYRWAKSCAVLAALMLVCAGPRGEVAAQGITVTPANPTISVGQTQQFTASGARTPTAVSAGAFFSCVRLSDGTAECTGRNQFGQLGNGDGTFTSSSVPVAVSGLTAATRVATGGEHACALLGDSTVRCWGAGDSGQRGDGTFNNSSTVPVAVGGLTGAVTVVTGGYHTCALLGEGTMWCWGRNADGQLGDGTAGTQCAQTTGLCSSTPVRAGGITNPAAITAGGYHTCALLGDGTVWCWGRNGQGQLGDGTTTSSTTPVRVGGITGAVAIAVGQGGVHTCALLADGSVKCWGALGAGNGVGQLGNGSTTGSATPVTMTGTGGTGVTWASSNTTVATIDATGLATGRSAGTATITATGGSGTSASTTLTVTDRVTLSVVLAGTGTGSVSSSPPGITCGTDCSEPYDRGTVVTLTASPGSGSAFGSWSGCTTVSGATCTVTMTAAKSVTATFNVQRFALTVNRAGTGSGTVTSSDGLISCPSTCTATYDSSTSVTLTASPASGSTFTAWSGCDTVSGATCTVTMTAAKSVTATFNAAGVSVTVMSARSGDGTATSSSRTPTCPRPAAPAHDGGISAALTAGAAPAATS